MDGVWTVWGGSGLVVCVIPLQQIHGVTRYVIPNPHLRSERLVHQSPHCLTAYRICLYSGTHHHHHPWLTRDILVYQYRGLRWPGPWLIPGRGWL